MKFVGFLTVSGSAHDISDISNSCPFIHFKCMPIRLVLLLSIAMSFVNAILVRIAKIESSDQIAPLGAVVWSGLQCLPVPYVRYEVVTILEDSISR